MHHPYCSDVAVPNLREFMYVFRIDGLQKSSSNSSGSSGGRDVIGEEQEREAAPVMSPESRRRSTVTRKTSIKVCYFTSSVLFSVIILNFCFFYTGDQFSDE